MGAAQAADPLNDDGRRWDPAPDRQRELSGLNLVGQPADLDRNARFVAGERNVRYEQF